jgi:hypothetical protein
VIDRRLRAALATAAVLAAAVAAPRAQTPEDNADRLRLYHERIAAESRRLAPGASLAELVVPVFALAAARSAAAGATTTAADENRAAILALTLYVNGWNPAMFTPEAKTWAAPVRRDLVLRGRGDLAQHFIVSAVIAAAAGSPVAAAAGLYKELSDARDGSGFSFSDLAADRAGERFGLAATRSEASARDLQARIGQRLAEADMMPPIDGLVDNLSEAELKRRFGGVGAPAYNSVIDEIDRRVMSLPLLR